MGALIGIFLILQVLIFAAFVQVARKLRNDDLKGIRLQNRVVDGLSENQKDIVEEIQIMVDLLRKIADRANSNTQAIRRHINDSAEANEERELETNA